MIVFTLFGIRWKCEAVGWLWTQSVIAAHRPIGADLVASYRFGWWHVQLWREGSR